MTTGSMSAAHLNAQFEFPHSQLSETGTKPSTTGSEDTPKNCQSIFGAILQNRCSITLNVEAPLTETFSDMTDRSGIEAALVERIRFEELIAEISSEFVSTSENELETTTVRTLRKIGEFMAVDRVLLFGMNPDQSVLSCQFEWTAPGIAPAITRLQHQPRLTNPWLFPKLFAGELLVVPRVSDLPDAASAERTELLRHGVQSLVWAPIQFGGRIVGALCLDSLRTQRTWSEQLVSRLKLVGNILAIARERINSERTLRASFTERQRAEEDLQRHRNELARVDRINTLGEMAAEIAHEISQPLYSITNFVNAAKNVVDQHSEPDLKQVASWLQQASNAANNAGEIIQRLRLFARSHPHQRHKERVAVLVKEAITFMEFEMRRCETRVVLELDGGNATVLVDRVQILQVFVNILQNACESMASRDPSERFVTVSVFCDRQKISVSVRDRGVGLPDDERNIFEPFVTSKPQGLGLGLAISKTIIEKHGGQLYAERNSDVGAIFHVVIPLTKETEQ